MRHYEVEFSDAAESELIESIAWGIEVWGAEATFRWARQFREKTRRLLSQFPAGQPLAPENDFYTDEIHQLILGRYRVLFAISGTVVNILHIRGPFSGKE